MPQRILNAQQSPVEEIAKEEQAQLDRAATFPDRIVLTGCPPTQDQQGGTCVAHAAYFLYQWWYKRKYGHFAPITEPSILRFYDLMKQVDHQPDPQRIYGTSLLTAMRTLAGSGFPLDTGGRGPKITGYHYVGDKAHDGRLALAQFGSPIAFALGWDANWFYLPTSHILKAPVGQIVGGHAMAEYGYDLAARAPRKLDIDRNSWDGWSSDGFGSCYFDEAYKDDPAYWYECWQVTGIA
jgi:hypothetical protein